jgi:hypothetical protein
MDEVQGRAPETMFAPVAGLHRAAQLSLPLVVAGAWLSSLPRLLGAVGLYVERMFDFREIA